MAEHGGQVRHRGGNEIFFVDGRNNVINNVVSLSSECEINRIIYAYTKANTRQ
jgi:hypothetical protein